MIYANSLTVFSYRHVLRYYLRPIWVRKRTCIDNVVVVAVAHLLVLYTYVSSRHVRSEGHRNTYTCFNIMYAVTRGPKSSEQIRIRARNNKIIYYFIHFDSRPSSRSKDTVLWRTVYTDNNIMVWNNLLKWKTNSRHWFIYTIVFFLIFDEKTEYYNYYYYFLRIFILFYLY